MMYDFTTVTGVDARTLEQLRHTWPTWRKWCPAILQRPMVVFHDHSVDPDAILTTINHPAMRLWFWPPRGVVHGRICPDRWGEPQRYKMLAGYVHVPPLAVNTPYWLKIDTDVCAAPGASLPVDLFKSDAKIIAPAWHYTRPGDQMLDLDAWVARNPTSLEALAARPPLDLSPPPGWQRVMHIRICSWCAFFDTRFTRHVSDYAALTCGAGQLPVPSQDGLMWYCCERLGLPIIKWKPKANGWRLTSHGVLAEISQKLLAEEPAAAAEA